MRLIPVVFAFASLLFCQTASAAQKSVTFYLDGACVEQDAPASNGYLEFALPGSFTPGSFRVKPLAGKSVLRVELVTAEQDRRRRRKIARLEQRKGELQGRMQALSRREEIFRAAAKTQSGKAPRKTKASPDPLGTLQQGTDFALARLDSVYRNQRKCLSSLEGVEWELAAARKGAPFARVWLSGGRARISYQVGDKHWTPHYDFRWTGAAEGELLLHARLPPPEKGVLYRVSAGTVAQGLAARRVSGDFPTLSRFPLTLRNADRSAAPLSFSFVPVEAGLPPGEASVFWRGEYLGSGQFAGSGASELLLGNR